MDNKYYRQEVYEKLPDEEKEIINGMYKAMNEHCKDNDIKLAYDDRAEWFIGAITEYYLKSKGE